jgi:quinol monooxygenase YgiN
MPFQSGRTQAVPKHYLVAAHFELLEGSFEELLAEARRVASDSIRDESGCSRYDVLELTHKEGMLYELFNDQTDHELHKKTPHFVKFWERTAHLKVRWTVEHGCIRERNVFDMPSDRF